jgi:hypothetical protein
MKMTLDRYSVPKLLDWTGIYMFVSHVALRSCAEPFPIAAGGGLLRLVERLTSTFSCIQQRITHIVLTI